MYVSIILFYSAHGYPLYLHSFPTRRSSDLVAIAGVGVQEDGRYALIRFPEPALVAEALRSKGKIGVLVRSEEHTSELQSHVNLVCRLLLEKKKHEKRELTIHL